VNRSILADSDSDGEKSDADVQPQVGDADPGSTELSDSNSRGEG